MHAGKPQRLPRYVDVETFALLCKYGLIRPNWQQVSAAKFLLKQMKRAKRLGLPIDLP